MNDTNITNNMTKFIGQHVSSSGGPQNAVKSAKISGCDAFAFFLSSPNRWTRTSNCKDSNVNSFKNSIIENNYDLNNCVVPHGNYLINLASSDPDIYKKSYETISNELKICNQLGIKLYNFHPGSSKGGDKNIAITNLINAINNLMKEIDNVTILIENMAGQGNVLCKSFEEIAAVINGIENKDRIGVTIDTCHLFAAGYDISTEEGYINTFKEFDEIVGIKYIKAFHLNDSKEACGLKKDRHEDIGYGHIGIEFFKMLLSDIRFDNLAFITETPCTNVNSTDEIAILKSFCNQK